MPATRIVSVPSVSFHLTTGSLPVVKWKDTDGTETILVAGTDYLVETNGEQCGYIVLPYSGVWPSGTLYPSNAISIRFYCGYATQAAVPKSIKSAVKRMAVNFYVNKGDNTTGQTVIEDKTYDRMCNIIGRLHDMDFI